MKIAAKKKAAYLLILSMIAAFCILSANSDNLQHIHIMVSLKDFYWDMNKLLSQGYDMAGFNKSDSTVHLIVCEEEYHQLMDMGYSIQILPEPEPFKRSSGDALKAPEPVPQNIIIDDGYHSFQQIEMLLRQFQQLFPHIARMVSLGTSHYGRNIWALKVSDNVSLDEDEPAIMFNGLHHARELISTEVVLDTINYLTGNYGKDPDVTRWVDNWEIWLIPVVNPDGCDIVFTKDPDWRKNARDNNLNNDIDNDDGVDINRNYPFKWGLTPGSSGIPNSSNYRGPSPASEPEVQAIIALSQKKKFVFCVAYHSYGGAVLYPYGSMAAVNPMPNISRSVCAEFANLCLLENNRKYDFMPRLYDVNGLDRDWHYNNGTIGFVVELGTMSFQPEYNRWRNLIVEGVRPGWKYLLNRIDGSSISGHAADQQTGLPLEATITVDEISFFEGEIKTSHPETGRYHWIVAPGIYNVSFSATGYISESFLMNVKSGTAFNLDVALHQEIVSSSGEAESITEHSNPTIQFDESALLQNYPNPFNPVTWIPYKISNPAEVSISIYDLKGVLIRRLQLGRREPGSYTIRSKAAFWDGKNESGEYVANGVYFYMIKAGDFSAARKLIVVGL